MNSSVDGPDADNGAGSVLRNGCYAVALTPAGGGWSRFGDYAVTDWSDDPTRDADGFFIYLRDVDTGHVWSVGLQPTLRRADRYVARSGPPPGIEREDCGIRTVLEVAVPDGQAAELRRLTLGNLGGRTRRIEITTCVPLALDTPVAFGAHRAFSKLFIQTHYVPALQGLAARRRPRSPDEPALSAVHLLVPEGPSGGNPGFETDRAAFIGRGRTLAAPRALDPGAALTGSAGNVLDPVLCLRREVRIEPGGVASFLAVLAAGLTLADAEAAAARYAQPPAARIGTDASETGGTTDAPGASTAPGTAFAEEPLRFFNGYGGFTEAGTEYVIRLGSGPGLLRLPPLPWVNVVANERVGFLASETGAGCTWAGNSRLNRLTPWSNDPVSDPHGEALYLRDEATGAFWSPTPGPVAGAGPYETRHGFGYTHYRHSSRGLDQDTWLFVAPDDPIKIARVRVANRTDRPRRVSAYAYFEWVLGASGAQARRGIETERCPAQAAVLAWNPAREDFTAHVAFAAAIPHGGPHPVGVMADRAAFLGHHGSVAAPAALVSGGALPPASERPSDPCAVLHITLDVRPGEAVECAFLLGQAESRETALELVGRYRLAGAVERTLTDAREYWRRLLGRVSIRTPSAPLDLMVNGWLMYQNLSCRLWGRTAFYQSGGAYGFRDQLQDAMALVYVDPARARRQILKHAAHQFPEGDVLHWWHPPASRGIRTRFADDLLWLPYATGFYVDAMGDRGILDERTGFVLGRTLLPDEDEAYMTPERSAETVDLFEHCARAIDRALTAGSNGLPLMGTGDWNDGMNRVGREGRGESVWLGFFLVTILDRWISIARSRGEEERAARWAAHRASLEQALETAGWDGGWYRRAYYDDGAPIGSRDSDECRIDAIAQAWAVLSGVAPPPRVEQALDALEDQLVSEREGLIRLLTPPFDRTPHDPGYIKGYLPGVRENGGQYTHGALWAIRALAEAGRTDRAATLLEMLTPVARGATRDRIERYKVEPYVVAADVYGEPPHVGRGGWTWYTGSAAWMWRIVLESILGVTLEGGERLRVRPRIPCSWPGYHLRFQVPGGTTRYEIEVVRADGKDPGPRATLDDEPLAMDDGAAVIPLAADGRGHRVRIELGDQPDASIASPLDAITSA